MGTTAQRIERLSRLGPQAMKTFKPTQRHLKRLAVRHYLGMAKAALMDGNIIDAEHWVTKAEVVAGEDPWLQVTVLTDDEVEASGGRQ